MEKMVKEKNEQFDIYVKEKTRLMEKVKAECSGDEWVEINIGGSVYETRKATLTNLSCFFAQLFGNMTPTTDKKGIIFIDRDPKIFYTILNYARNGNDEKYFSNYFNNDESKYRLLKELDYYGIDIEFNSTIPIKGEKILVYWRGGSGNVYEATVLESNKCCDTITVRYTDGEIWKYDYSGLLKNSGEYSNMILREEFQKCKYMHYTGAVKIPKKTIK